MTARYQVKVLKIFCKGCELCIGICPRRALALSQSVNKGGHHFPEPDSKICSGCGQCAIICPEAAIEITRINGQKGKDK